MILDTFTYNGERDILKIHLSIMAPYVDKFIICEAKTTFTRNPKPLYFFRDQRYFKQFWPKITYYVINDDYTDEEYRQAKESPNTHGASHWQWEFLQKESIHKALKSAGAQPDDTVFIGDVDEIINPTIEFESETPIKAKLDVYTYYLNNRSSEQFWGTLIANYKDIEGKCLNHMRSNTKKSEQVLGWHFTSQGGIKEMQRKLNDSYTAESYNTTEIQKNLPQNIKERKDFLGRDFTFTVDETNWPSYLTNNRDKYKHLLWENKN